MDEIIKETNTLYSRASDVLNKRLSPEKSLFTTNDQLKETGSISNTQKNGILSSIY
jgi:hypothetical protein